MATQGTEVPSVNEKPAQAPDVEQNPDTQWVDPIFLEKAEAVLPDDPDNTTEIVDPAPDPDPEPAPAADPEPDPAAAEADDDEDDDDTDDDAEQAASEDNDGKPAKRRTRSVRRREARATQREREQQLREENIDLRARLETLERMTAGASDDDDDDDDAANVETAAASTQTGDVGEAVEETAGKPAPTLEDHDYDTDEWAKAYTEWSEENTKRLIAAGKAEAEKAEAAQAAEAAEAAQRQERLAGWHDRQADARDRYEDYDDVVYAEDVFIPESVVDLLVESDAGPDIAYHLATNQDEARALSEMTPAKLALTVARMETRFMPEGGSSAAEKAADSSDNSPSPGTSPRRTVTSAPPPVEPVTTGSGASTRNPDSASMDEYIEARRSGRIR